MWRLTGEQRVLELFPADLSKSQDDKQEANLTLRFGFQDPILPAGTAISDSDTGADIHVFVCTIKNELSHLKIHPNAFRTEKAISKDTGQWCFAIQEPVLTINTVFRVHAHTPFELIISYEKGLIQRLLRKGDSKAWTPTTYNDKTWGASFRELRGLYSQGTFRDVSYGSTSVDARCVQAMQLSADSTHLFTVCLNHQLRVWNLTSGRLVVAVDLLNKARQPNDRTQLNPAEAGHMQLYKLGHMKHSMLITYSPHEGGQFKFWDVKGGLTDALAIEDRYPQLKLSPPDPDPTGNTVWSMAGFHIAQCAVDPTNSVCIWVLWRNNNHHQLYSTRFVLGDPDKSWKSEWVSCIPNGSRKVPPPDHVKSSPDDATSQWLDFLLYPGRYTAAVLETALSTYSEALTMKVPSSQKSDGLKARLSSVVGANVALRKYDQSNIDFDRFTTDVDAQWRNFARIVENVNDGRLAPLALAYDLFQSEPWVVMADRCCAVRECSKLELVTMNEPTELDDIEGVCETLWAHRKVDQTDRGIGYENLAQLVTVARNFRQNLSSELIYNLDVAIETDVLTNPETSTPGRILEIYDEVAFGDAVSDDTFHRLQNDFKPLGELEQLSGDLVLAVLDLLPSRSTHQSGHLRSTSFGLNLLANGTLDLMTATRQVLWNLLALVIFIEGELNQDEQKMSTFDAADLSTQIGSKLRFLDRNIWLSTHSRRIPLLSADSDQSAQTGNDARSVLEKRYRVASIFEDGILQAESPLPVDEMPNTYLLTETLHAIDQTAMKAEGDVDYATVLIQCNLLTHRDIDLASEFLRFQPSSPWSTYIKGRLYLYKHEYDQAAQYFRQCAYGMACGKAVGDLSHLSAGLLSPYNTNSFYNGMPQYLQHVISLFESVHAYSQAIVFAKLALEALLPGQKETSALRSEILSRLFTAHIKTTSFQPAFDTLIQFSDQALQKSCATIFINAILDVAKSANSTAGAVHTLQSLPWSLYPVLSRHLDSQLSALAKKQQSTGPGGRGSTSSTSNVDYLKIVHAMRIARHDYRGAVAVLYERLRLVQRSSRMRQDPSMKELRHALLSLINAMTMIVPDEAYILAESEEATERANGDEGKAQQSRKRRKVIITLDDLKKDYQRVLDGCARVERGDFDFGETEEDSEFGSDVEMDHSRINMSGALARNGDRMEL